MAGIPTSAIPAGYSGSCSRPYKLPTGDYVRCGSRFKTRCAPCAELYRSDWAAIARSGIFDGDVADFKFYLLTLTAPSFGRVHRVPRSSEKVQKCGCGALHTVADAALRGVPLDSSSYDYAGQAAWNRDSGVLWDRTRKRLRDRWDSLEYFLVREWQDRGVLHLHLLVRIARFEAPSAEQLRDDARSAVAFSKIDGSQIVWGAQARCDALRADGAGARTVWYLSKALGYMLKHTALHGMGGRNHAWEHQLQLELELELEHGATEMRCSTECVPWLCKSRVHERYGSRAQVVSASRRTKHRTGWSFTGLTRTVQRQLRKAWFDAQVVAEESSAASPEIGRWLLESLSDRARRELEARAAAVP